MHSGPPDFLIVGTPRSGTTLVQRLATELDGVAVPPETHFFRLFAPALLRRRDFPLEGDALVEELRAFSVLEDLRGIDLDPVTAARRLGRVETVMELFGGIVRELAGDAALYGEKTPSHLRWWRELSGANPALRFVAVVRDPRAVVASYFEAWGERPHSVIAERWAIDHRSLIVAQRTLGERLLVLRYEEVVADPTAACQQLSRFLGRPPAARPDRRPERELHLPWETWKARSSGPVTKDRVGGWRQTLPNRTAREIETIAGAEMRRFGYAPEHGPIRLAPRDQLLRYRYRVDRYVEGLRRRRLARRPDFA
jgi:hypothetical protein